MKLKYFEKVKKKNWPSSRELWALNLLSGTETPYKEAGK